MNDPQTGSLSSQMPKDADIHTFSLKSVLGVQSPIEQLIHSFQNSGEQSEEKQAGLSQLPTFNADALYFTPCFMLKEEKLEFESNEMEMMAREAFEKKIQLTIHYTNSLLEPKPSSSYCHICKEPFDDYLKHVSHKVHQQNCADTNYSYFIHQLIEDFQAQSTAGRFKRRGSDSGSFCQSDQQEGRLKKRRIVENSSNFGPLAVSFCKEAPSSTNCSSFQQKSKKGMRSANSRSRSSFQAIYQ